MAETISEAVSKCKSAFDRITGEPENPHHATSGWEDWIPEIQNQSDRLALWSHGVGASSGTLDDTLSKTSDLRLFTLRLLNELVAEVSDFNLQTIDDQFEEVEDIISTLVRLEKALVKPGPQHAVEVAASFGLLNAVVASPCIDAVEQPQSIENERLEQENRKQKLQDLVQSCRLESLYSEGQEDPFQIDLCFVPNFDQSSFWRSNDPAGRFEIDPDASSGLLGTMLQAFREIALEARTLQFTYGFDSLASVEDPFDQNLNSEDVLQTLASALVQEINNARFQDPERPLMFVAHSLGGIIAKKAISMLLQEGLSVRERKPITGCLFFAVPHTRTFAPADLSPWLYEVWPAMSKQPNETLVGILDDIRLTNIRFSSCKQDYQIDCLDCFETRPFNGNILVSERLVTDSEAMRYALDLDHFSIAKGDPRTVFPAVYQMVQLAQKESREFERAGVQNKRKADEVFALPQLQDQFAMLLACNTAILIDDSAASTSTTMWSSIIDIVRDCVDIVGNYRDDVDLQLFSSPTKSYSVDDSSKAARILSGLAIGEEDWSFLSQLRDYLALYISNLGLQQRDPLPCNIIVLTCQAPKEDLGLIYESCKMLANLPRDTLGFTLKFRVQLAVVGNDLHADVSLNALDNAVRRTDAIAEFFTESIRLSARYYSNAQTCKRLLLGALSSRYAGKLIVENYDIFKSATNPKRKAAKVRSRSEGGDSGFYSEPTTRSQSVLSIDEEHGWDTLDLQKASGGTIDPGRSNVDIWLSQFTGDSHGEAAHEDAAIVELDPPSLQQLCEETRASDPLVGAQAQPAPILGRVQKHTATFQCSLCPKRFTRAYNLRFHLRTHTDERPFVCTICGKAFARQHERKRHEGLHSGEKKFVCRGILTSNTEQWGCGRRFARADALGRHFRSEAGRACIKPLLDEEARARDSRRIVEFKGWGSEHTESADPPGWFPMPYLPDALFQQYPEVAKALGIPYVENSSRPSADELAFPSYPLELPAGADSGAPLGYPSQYPFGPSEWPESSEYQDDSVWLKSLGWK